VRADSVGYVLGHDLVKDHCTPRITNLFQAVKKGQLPRSACKIVISLKPTLGMKQAALKHTIGLSVTAMNLQSFLFIWESAISSLRFNRSYIIARIDLGGCEGNHVVVS